MSKSTNDEVALFWKLSRPAENHRGSFWTDGLKLYSYDLQIGDTCPVTNTKILKSYTAKGSWGFKSQTTSCHVGLAATKADVVS